MSLDSAKGSAVFLPAYLYLSLATFPSGPQQSCRFQAPTHT